MPQLKQPAGDQGIPRQQKYARGERKKESEKRGLGINGIYVIVTPIEADDQTPTGLFLPETAKEKPQQGKVKEYLILKETDIPAIVENGRQ